MVKIMKDVIEYFQERLYDSKKFKLRSLEVDASAIGVFLERLISSESKIAELQDRLTAAESELINFKHENQGLKGDMNSLVLANNKTIELLSVERGQLRAELDAAKGREPVAYAFYTAAGDIRIWWSAKAYDVYAAKDWAEANRVNYSDLVSLYAASILPEQATPAVNTESTLDFGKIKINYTNMKMEIDESKDWILPDGFVGFTVKGTGISPTPNTGWHLERNEQQTTPAESVLDPQLAIVEKRLGELDLGVMAHVVAKARKTIRSVEQVSGGGEPKLSVWYGPMPESNGKENYTAILYRKSDDDFLGGIGDGITIDRSEYPDRVRYEADRMRYMIGELEKEPFILDYDSDKHTGYIEQASPNKADVPTHYYARESTVWWYRNTADGFFAWDLADEGNCIYGWIKVHSGKDVNHDKWLKENLKPLPPLKDE